MGIELGHFLQILLYFIFINPIFLGKLNRIYEFPPATLTYNFLFIWTRYRSKWVKICLIFLFEFYSIRGFNLKAVIELPQKPLFFCLVDCGIPYSLTLGFKKWRDFSHFDSEELIDLGRKESNLPIPGSKPVALPLGYAPFRFLNDTNKHYYLFRAFVNSRLNLIPDKTIKINKINTYRISCYSCWYIDIE